MLRLNQIIQDARFGLRQLGRSPLVATVAILTLAIGIGLNTAVFTLVNAVLLRPLPYTHAERLVWIAPYDERFGQDTFASRGDYLVWKQQTQVFERMAAYGTQDLNLIIGGEASQERIASVGGDFWEITGARAMFGRLPADDEEQSVILCSICRSHPSSWFQLVKMRVTKSFRSKHLPRPLPRSNSFRPRLPSFMLFKESQSRLEPQSR